MRLVLGVESQIGRTVTSFRR